MAKSGLQYVIFIMPSDLQVVSVFSAMAIAAESLPGCARVGVTLETEISIVVVPGSVTVKLTEPAAMDALIGSPHAIGVPMTSCPGTGRITGIMT